MDFHSYHGSNMSSVFDQQPCLRLRPDGGGRSRHVSLETFQPPIKIAGWARLLEHTGQTTPTHRHLDGLHIHFGHIGNNRNYVFSAVLRNGQSRIMREYGWRGYDRLATGKSEFVPGRVYLFEVEWRHGKIKTIVADEVQTRTLNARIPRRSLVPSDVPEGTHKPRLPMGSIGFRFDNIVADIDVSVERL